MQQINLYQPILRQQEKVFSAKTLLQAGLVVVAGLLLVYAYAAWQTRTLASQLKGIQAQHAEAEQRLNRVLQQFPPQSKDPVLEAQLKAKRDEYAAKERLVGVLNQPHFGNTTGFSNTLEALARERPQQLWIRELTISNGGQDIALLGSTYVPAQVPQFLQALGKESPLQGLEFEQLRMERPEKHPDRIDFLLRTRPEEPEKKP